MWLLVVGLVIIVFTTITYYLFRYFSSMYLKIFYKFIRHDKFTCEIVSLSNFTLTVRIDIHVLHYTCIILQHVYVTLDFDKL